MRRSATLAIAALIAAPVTAVGGAAQDRPTQEEEPVLGRSSASNFQAQEAAKTIELGPGSRLRLAPDLLSPLLEIVAESETAAILERHEGWVRVRYGIWKGWVLESGRDTGLLVSAAPPDRQDIVRLDRVREIMGDGARETTLGPYALITDLPDGRLDRRLDLLVATLAESYLERFGLDPGPPRGELIVIFDREGDYRQFEREDLRLAGMETQGYTSQALLSDADAAEAPVVSILTATFLGRREPELLREILVHELTHMLNWRAVGPYLPPWLEEGLAEELAFSQVDSGRLILGSWGGSTEIRMYTSAGGAHRLSTNLKGSRAALEALLNAWRTPYRPELELLSQLSWEMLVTPAGRSLLYAQSGLLTRYLLDGAGEEAASRFRGYLAGVADGEIGSDALWSQLEASPRALENDFYRWMRRTALAYGVRVPN